MARKKPREIVVPTHGGEYEQLADGSLEPTSVERDRQAEAERLEAERKAEVQVEADTPEEEV